MPDNPGPAENDEALVRSVAHVLETTCYAAVLGEASAPDREEGCISVRVRFEGRSSGCLTVTYPRRVAETLATDFLGARSAQPPGRLAVEEALSEVTNMITGTFLSEIQRDAIFRLIPPQILTGDEAAAKQASARWLDLGDGALGVTLRLEPPAVP
jgi:CheY-specific phosphatase CheX